MRKVEKVREVRCVGHAPQVGGGRVSLTCARTLVGRNRMVGMVLGGGAVRDAHKG